MHVLFRYTRKHLLGHAFFNGFNAGVALFFVLHAERRHQSIQMLGFHNIQKTVGFFNHHESIFGFASFRNEFFFEAHHLGNDFLSLIEGFNGLEFGDFFGTAFHHHDAVFGARDNQFQIGDFELFCARVHHQLAVDEAHFNGT